MFVCILLVIIILYSKPKYARVENVVAYDS